MAMGMDDSRTTVANCGSCACLPSWDLAMHRGRVMVLSSEDDNAPFHAAKNGARSAHSNRNTKMPHAPSSSYLVASRWGSWQK